MRSLAYVLEAILSLYLCLYRMQYLSVLLNDILLDLLGFVSWVGSYSSAILTRTLFSIKSWAVVIIIPFHLQRIRNSLARLWSSIWRQELLARILSNDYIFLSTGRSSTLVPLFVLQIILLWLRKVLGILTCASGLAGSILIHSSLKAGLRWHSVACGILDRIGHVHLVYDLLLVCVEFLIGHIHRWLLIILLVIWHTLCFS